MVVGIFIVIVLIQKVQRYTAIYPQIVELLSVGKFGKVENRHRISMNVNTLPFAIPASNLAQLVFEMY